jgi:predicted nucleotidyltransferase
MMGSIADPIARLQSALQVDDRFAAAIAFGSRVRGTARPDSDLADVLRRKTADIVRRCARLRAKQDLSGQAMRARCV